MSDTTPPDAPAPDSAAADSAAAILSAYAESAIIEDEALRAARARAEELGAPTVSPSIGALLALLARVADARHVVEVGTGAGVSGLWLLSGMSSDGVLTTIDAELEHHRAARASFADAGIAPGRTRLINGTATDVLTRLTDDSYDLVFVDGPLLDHPRYVTEAIRMLRPGGVVVVHNATADGRVADRSATDPMTRAAREAAMLIADDERLLPVIVPLGAGVLAAAKAR